MTPEEKIEFAAGQVHALMGVCHALILSHQNLPLLSRSIELLSQANLAGAETKLVDDHYIDGIQDIWARMRKALETAPEQRAILETPRRDHR
jgi:hypothetical protein